jgi:hypothetical protein
VCWHVPLQKPRFVSSSIRAVGKVQISTICASATGRRRGMCYVVLAFVLPCSPVLLTDKL